MLIKKKPLSRLLGLSFDQNRLEGVLLRRTNGSLVVQKSFSVELSLDLLTNDPDLAGREIRGHLEQAGIRERRCAVNIPLAWALMLQTKLPELPEADTKSFLQIEAERGFPYGLESLLISVSRYRSATGEHYATQVAVAKDHVARLTQALKAAQLRPVTLSLGVVSLQPPATGPDGILTIVLGENSVAFAVSAGGGMLALRTVEGGIETEGSQKHLRTELIHREIRITLGQLPAEVRRSVRRLRIFGHGTLPEQLAADLQSRMQLLGIAVELVRNYNAADFGLTVPPDTTVSAAFSLAARRLAGQPSEYEFLPPKTSQWRQLTSRYSSRKLVYAGVVAGSLALLIGLAFLVQQWQLSRLRSRWESLAPRVAELENLQQQIRKFRPWFDDSLRSLSILRRVTESFPEDGNVSAKTLEIRELATVTCSGSARDSQALLKTLDQLRSASEVSDVKVDQIRGKAPLQFTFNFRWQPNHE